MSLRRCRECGHFVSTKARACPACGLPEPTRTGSSGRGRWARVLLALFLATGAIGAGIAVRLHTESRPVEPMQPSAAPTRFTRLSARLGRSGGRIVVTNLDAHDWTSCMVDVNAGVPGGGFSRPVDRIGAGDQIGLRLDTFARADGRQFDESAEPVQVVDLHCDTPEGPAHFTGGV